ncbi:MAG: hypothetical protein ACE5H8_07800 [Alphaproteobacteria bacterium]
MSAALVVPLLLVVSGAFPAAAAPQILGVIASIEPVTLQCERGECGAEFTAYCLEQHRRSPAQGTAYDLYDPDSLVVEGTRRDGAIIRLTAGLVTIVTERGNSAIRMSVPEPVLRRFDLASVRISVGERVTLIPKPVADDPQPHSETDIALAAGPLRSAAAVIVDNGGERVDAARLTERAINALPRRGRASDAERKRVWRTIAPETGKPGFALAREGYDRCYTVTRAGMQSLRQCLGSVHDSLIGKLNTKYWHAIEAGS